MHTIFRVRFVFVFKHEKKNSSLIYDRCSGKFIVFWFIKKKNVFGAANSPDAKKNFLLRIHFVCFPEKLSQKVKFKGHLRSETLEGGGALKFPRQLFASDFWKFRFFYANIIRFRENTSKIQFCAPIWTHCFLLKLYIF